MSTFTRIAVFPVVLVIAVAWRTLDSMTHLQSTTVPQDPDLPAGVSEYGDGINGAEPRGDDGLTESERREIEKAEHRADLEREGW